MNDSLCFGVGILAHLNGRREIKIWSRVPMEKNRVCLYASSGV